MKFLSKWLLALGLVGVLTWAGLGLLERARAPINVPYVDLVVPDGFRGGILVVSPPSGHPLIVGSRTSYVTERGLVTGPGAEPFFTNEGFAFRRITFVNGKVLRSDLSFDLLPDEVGLRETDIADDRGMWFFVGNRNQWLQFMEGVPKPGRVQSAP